MLTIKTIVTCQRGSWKWQNAYRIAIYAPRQTVDGRTVWANVGYATGKMSMPQIRRSVFNGILEGGMHNHELTPAQKSAAVFAEAGLI